MTKKILKKSEDFITQVGEFLTETTLTNPRWAEAIATSLISLVMGPERYISDIKGKLNLNVWFLCIGPSGMGQKTTPMKTYLLPILAKMTEISDYPYILPSRYSVESMIGYMDEHNLGAIIRDEFTSMFKESYAKEYLADSLEFLSELYDGIIHPRSTFSHGTNKMKKCYVNLIAATTPYLFKVMKADFFTQGTGNRIFIVMFDDESVSFKPLDPDNFFKGQVFEDKREKFIEEVAEILCKIRQTNAQYLIPDDEDASKIWTEFEYQCRTKAREKYKKNAYDLHYTYLSRLPEMVLKLSGVYAMSRSWSILHEKGCPRELLIIEQDMKKAVDQGWYHYEQFCKMLNAWRKVPDKSFVQSYQEQGAFIVDKIESTKEGNLKWYKVRKDLDWDSRTIKEAIKHIHQTHKIVIVHADSKGGRKPVKLCLPHKIVPGLIIKDWRTIEGMLNL